MGLFPDGPSFGAYRYSIRSKFRGVWTPGMKEGGSTMRRRVHLAIGALCGVLCVAGILAYAADLRADVDQERSEALARYGGEQVEILVATDDIAVGDMLDTTNAEKRLWLSELVPDDAISDHADVAALPVTSPIYAGEVVLRHRFDEREEVALQVPDGKCAISVPSKAVTAVGGSLRPGSKVDVYSVSGSATDLLASRVLVLSTSTTSEEKDANRKSDVTWVTLALDPAMVEEVITASQKSELYFALPSESASANGAAKSASFSNGTRNTDDGLSVKVKSPREGDADEFAPTKDVADSAEKKEETATEGESDG